MALLLMGWPPSAQALNDAQQLVVDAWRLVNQSYVDPERFEEVHWRQLRQQALERRIESSGEAYDAIAAMLAPLEDPYTRFLSPSDYSALRSSTKGSVSGVGLQLGTVGSDQAIVVIAPLDGSPAAEAAISSGSVLLEVEGESCVSLGLEATAARLRGPAGSRVQILVRSSEGIERQLLLERRTVDLQPVRHRELDAQGHRLGYLRISQFSEQVPEQVRQVLAGFVSHGVEGLVLDLRNNSGGLVDAGVAVAGALLDGQPIVETRTRSGLSEGRQAAPGQLFRGPMLTLVNGGTASASEILAGALQDDGRSRLLGSRTFGKGLIQTLIGLGDGSGLTVTVARYVTPSGRDIQSLGIAPDQALAEPEPLNPGGEDDTWLAEAAARLAGELAS
ncbi:PDZ domain-containing protein [Synechococcus sp. ATX 2A4]|nr:carboxyl-terminal processing protease CtpZ [Synechococcus sp. ATX 2A4]MCP9885209.1 PDZ domain-containing protein [Synechococcus sp. ATX 2A4]